MQQELDASSMHATTSTGRSPSQTKALSQPAAVAASARHDASAASTGGISTPLPSTEPGHPAQQGHRPSPGQRLMRHVRSRPLRPSTDTTTSSSQRVGAAPAPQRSSASGSALQQRQDSASASAATERSSSIAAARTAVAEVVQAMEGALQAELHEEQLHVYCLLGRGGFGTVYHGVLAALAPLEAPCCSPHPAARGAGMQVNLSGLWHSSSCDPAHFDTAR